jgi:hypothetical protein
MYYCSPDQTRCILGELTVHLWLKEGWKNGNKKISNIKIDQKTGRFYLEFIGDESFKGARLVPEEWIDLIAVKHKREEEEQFPGDSRLPGIYIHNDVRIVSDNDRNGANRLTITGSNLDQVEEAIGFFEQMI